MLWAALGAVAELAAPRRCAVCDEPGRGVCDSCLRSLALVMCDPPELASPDPCPPGLPPTWALTTYEGAIAGAIKAHKDAGRYDLAPVLGCMLRCALESVLTDVAPSGAVHVVTAPSSAASVRLRGRRPLDDIVRVALRGSGINHDNGLRSVRRVRDQAGLSAADRARNLGGSMRADRRPRDGLCVVVDDVVTTGATLCEAARALRAAGAGEIIAIALAATQRRAKPSAVRPRRLT